MGTKWASFGTKTAWVSNHFGAGLADGVRQFPRVHTAPFNFRLWAFVTFCSARRNPEVSLTLVPCPGERRAGSAKGEFDETCAGCILDICHLWAGLGHRAIDRRGRPLAGRGEFH